MNANDQECVEWGRAILCDLDLSDWAIKFTPGKSSDGIALQNVKEICISWVEGEPDYVLMLHEITHAQVGSGHDSHFSHANMKLQRRYFKPVKGS